VTDPRRVRAIVLVIVLLAVPLTAGAQPTGKYPRIGTLRPGSPPDPLLEAFRQGLRELGYVEGRNIMLETRSSFPRELRDYEIATELVRRQVNVIVALSTGATYAAMDATKTIPIVMTYPGDPVASGVVAGLERPGGNVTGVTGSAGGLGGKMLELLKEIVPEVRRVAVLWNPGPENTQIENSRIWRGAELAARSLRVELQPLPVRPPDDLTGAFRSAISIGADSFMAVPGIVPGIVGSPNLRETARFALESRLPGISWRADFAEAGGLVAYGGNRLEQSRRAAYFVDKILRGAKAGELPVETTLRFELIVNLKTAKALGITIPPRVLAWADRVIK
jgi:putative ABC transport system substrate-binding protein